MRRSAFESCRWHVADRTLPGGGTRWNHSGCKANEYQYACVLWFCGPPSADVHPEKPAPATFFGSAAVACLVLGCAWTVYANVFGASIYPTAERRQFRCSRRQAAGARGSRTRSRSPTARSSLRDAARRLPRPQRFRRAHRFRSTTVLQRRPRKASSRPKPQTDAPKLASCRSRGRTRRSWRKRRSRELTRPRSGRSRKAQAKFVAGRAGSGRRGRTSVAFRRCQAGERRRRFHPRHGATRQGGGDVDRFRREASRSSRSCGASRSRSSGLRCCLMLPPTPASPAVLGPSARIRRWRAPAALRSIDRGLRYLRAHGLSARRHQAGSAFRPRLQPRRSAFRAASGCAA